MIEEMTLPMMPAISREVKRIVFEHTQGKLAGIPAIMGLTSDFGLEPGKPLPDHAEGFEAHGRLIPFAGLIKVTNRYALYREPLLFGNQTSFHSEQQ